jgi:DNA-directed RNA polymerase subunit RPC12/RpoP
MAEMIEFICPRCDKTTGVWTLKNAAVECPLCHIWITNRTMKRRNPLILDEEKHEDELRMF